MPEKRGRRNRTTCLCIVELHVADGTSRPSASSPNHAAITARAREDDLVSKKGVAYSIAMVLWQDCTLTDAYRAQGGKRHKTSKAVLTSILTFSEWLQISEVRVPYVL